MVAQLNRFMALMALCGLLTQPAMAAPDGYQTLVVNGDTLVVQMAEPLPAGYQTLVVGGDTLMVRVLAEPLPTDAPPLAASEDSLSAQTGGHGNFPASGGWRPVRIRPKRVLTAICSTAYLWAILSVLRRRSATVRSAWKGFRYKQGGWTAWGPTNGLPPSWPLVLS